MAKRRPSADTTPEPDESAQRPLRLEWVEAGSLDDHPKNWRRHSGEQMDTLREVIADPEIGWAGALLFNEETNHLLNGHARKNAVDPTARVPVLIGRWSPQAEMRILAMLDPIGDMAERDREAQLAVLEEIAQLTAAPMQQSLVDSLLAEAERAHEHAKLKQLPTTRPPTMTWVLIGIPIVRFGEVAETVERIAGMDDVIIESISNDYQTGDQDAHPMRPE